MNGFIKQQVRIALQVFRIQHDMLHGMSVGCAKPSAESVKRQAKLASPPSSFKFKSLGVKPPIRRCKGYHGSVWMIRRIHLPPIQAAGNIHPSIQAQYWMTDPYLSRTVGIKPGQYGLFNICYAVSIGILKIKNIGSAGDKNAAFPGQNTIGVS